MLDANICRNVLEPGVFVSREAKLAASSVPIVPDSRWSLDRTVDPSVLL